MGFVLTKGTAPNTYTSFYAADAAPSGLDENTQAFVGSLVGWTPEARPMSLADKLALFETAYKDLPLAQKKAFASTALFVKGALELKDEELALSYLADAATLPDADIDLLEQLEALLNS